MITLDECLTDDARVLLVGPESEKKFISFFRQKEPKIYRKNFNHAEFVGESLCEIRNLKCAHYFLIGEGCFNVNRVARCGDIHRPMYIFRLGSYNFKKPGYEYFDLNSFSVMSGDYPDRLSKILSMAPNEKNRNELLNEIEEMFALDIYMGQTDRISSNIMFQRNPLTREIHLAPLYDFQYSLKTSYLGRCDIYDNSLFSMDNEEKFRMFVSEHPEFLDKLKSYLDVDLAKVVRWSYRGRGLIVPEEKFTYYRDFEKGRKELIQRIVR